MNDTRALSEAMGVPQARLCVGVTGHRDDHVAMHAHRPQIEAALGAVFAAIDAMAGEMPGPISPTRLHTLLAPGTDAIAIELALSRGWDVVAPLPFGLDLSIAATCRDADEADVRALIAGALPPAPAVAAEAKLLRDLAGRVRLFELADQDELVAERLLAAATAPEDEKRGTAYRVHASERAAVAARVMIEQSDVLVAVWDGTTPGSIGGTRHSIESALYHGAPVVLIDASAPTEMRLLIGPDALEMLGPAQEIGAIAGALAQIAAPEGSAAGERAARLHGEKWRTRSRRRFHGYRRIESLFGGGDGDGGRRLRRLVDHYESPDAIAEGSAAPLLAAARVLPGIAPGFVDRISIEVLRRFAHADGLSTYLADAYRGGMVMNFLLSALAVIAGAAYIPLVGVDLKWPFALTELILLLLILVITVAGRRQRWHGRWLETRRVAEYLRHAPILLMLGVARPPGRWPQGSKTGWPEAYARQTLRGLGLPRAKVTQAYLRAGLSGLLAPYVEAQRDYHRRKAVRLAAVHRRIDRFAEGLFALAILSVTSYLALILAERADWVPEASAHVAAKPLTFLGIALPALGGAFAGIRYLGDFERFAAISQVAAGKLEAISKRIDALLSGGRGAVSYAQVASIAHDLDDAVIAEIEGWQSVFALKNMAVPV